MNWEEKLKKEIKTNFRAVEDIGSIYFRVGLVSAILIFKYFILENL